MSALYRVESLLLMCAIDDPYSLEQLRDPRMNVSVVRPLVDKLYEPNDVSMGKSINYIAQFSFGLLHSILKTTAGDFLKPDIPKVWEGALILASCTGVFMLSSSLCLFPSKSSWCSYSLGSLHYFKMAL